MVKNVVKDVVGKRDLVYTLLPCPAVYLPVHPVLYYPGYTTTVMPLPPTSSMRSRRQRLSRNNALGSDSLSGPGQGFPLRLPLPELSLFFEEDCPGGQDRLGQER